MRDDDCEFWVQGKRCQDRDVPKVRVTGPLTPIDECREVAKSIARKADKNKCRARVLVLLMTLSTGMIPVVLVASQQDLIWGKIVPSGLAALTTVLVALNQLERPHERWVLYRRYHRLVSAEEKKYRFGVKPYADEDRDARLGRRVAELEIKLQAEWEGLIPGRGEIASISQGA
ncbi:arginyl-tRNA--protein-N-Asp/Glu arginylyltransferase [Microbacterium sp. W4I4]|uniref:DUF4231 domain-containing protein n=1 Tax=Microbacterium sp. W4I4 TaxID=3042295 RepID=UPI00277EC7C9|nr:DUF4231 domain-containing protein [Microbacterium sp. W4I4]MDQ0614417.1 arginyl-tRNA--protein-N-Asp/Glu arginylyltransferase [Microbacterium sp. W4I4]